MIAAHFWGQDGERLVSLPQSLETRQAAERTLADRGSAFRAESIVQADVLSPIK